jgi:sulfonate transport system substrate-binding protein
VEENLMRLKRVMISAIAGVAVLTASVAARAEPLKIRIAWIVPVANIAPILFAKEGIAKNLGKTYTIDPVRFQGTPPMITALAVNDIDIGLLGYSSMGLAIQNAGLEDLRIFADEFQDGAGNGYSNEFMVRKDSPVQKVADLKGKVLATNATGSAVDIAMRAMLRKAGLEDKRDYTVVEAGFGAMKAMLAEKKVELVPAVTPFSFDADLRSNARTLFTQKDAMGPSALGVWVAHDAFLKKNKAAVLDFLTDAMAATRWYLDPKNHDEAVKIASDFAKAPPKLFNEWLFTNKDYYRDPNLMPNAKELQNNMDLQRETGFLNTKIDIAKYIDTSYVEEASKRLK